MSLQEMINLIRTIVANDASPSIPDQTGNAGTILTTDGTNLSWLPLPSTPGLSDVLAASPNANGEIIQDVGVLTFKDNTNYIRMFSPNGTPWIIKVADDGTLSVVDDS